MNLNTNSINIVPESPPQVGSDLYCIKPTYHPRSKAVSLDTPDAPPYWTPNRIRLSLLYQYDVYALAQRLMRTGALKTVLDVGSGPGMKSKELLLPFADRLVLIDQPSTRKTATQNNPSAKFVGADLENPAVRLSEKFDLVVCSDVVEHLANPNPCMKFIFDHLTDSGVAVLSTPERDIVRGPDCDRSPNEDHVREWNSAEFAKYVSSQGFRIIDQLLLSQMRLSWYERILRRFVGWSTRSAKWHGCQTLIVGKIIDQSAAPPRP